MMVGSLHVCNNSWIKAGILTITGCINENSFLSRTQLEGKNMFPVTFLFYNGLTWSIPSKWLELLANTTNMDNVMVEKTQTLMIYKLNKKKYVEIQSQHIDNVYICRYVACVHCVHLTCIFVKLCTTINLPWGFPHGPLIYIYIYIYNF